MRRVRVPSWFVYVLVTVLLSNTIAGISSIIIAKQAVANSEQTWCESLTIITDGFTAPASTPPTERALRLAAALAKQKKKYGCA